MKEIRNKRQNKGDDFKEIMDIIDCIRAFKDINQENGNCNDFDDELNRSFQCNLKSKLITFLECFEGLECEKGNEVCNIFNTELEKREKEGKYPLQSSKNCKVIMYKTKKRRN